MRPNIRIEIQNNLADAMEVDENEEGELIEEDEPETEVCSISQYFIQKM